MKKKSQLAPGRKGGSAVGGRPHNYWKRRKVQGVPIGDIQALDRAPEDAAEYLALNAFWEPHLRDWVEGRLSASDRAMGKQYAKNPDALPDDLILRVKAALDGVIFQQANILGPRIFIFREVVNRLLEWWNYADGPRRFEQLGKELARGAAVSQGKKKMPLDPNMRLMRKELIAEVKMLRDRLRSRFIQRDLPGPEQLLRAVIALVRDDDEPFERLWANAASLERFIQIENHELLHLLVRGDITPTGFVEGWLARATNRDPQALRQAISLMPGDRAAPGAR